MLMEKPLSVKKGAHNAIPNDAATIGIGERAGMNCTVNSVCRFIGCYFINNLCSIIYCVSVISIRLWSKYAIVRIESIRIDRYSEARIIVRNALAHCVL